MHWEQDLRTMSMRLRPLTDDCIDKNKGSTSVLAAARTQGKSVNGLQPRQLLMLSLVSSMFRIQRLLLKNFCSQVHLIEAILSNSRRLFHTAEGMLYISSVFCLLGCIKGQRVNLSSLHFCI